MITNSDSPVKGSRIECGWKRDADCSPSSMEGRIGFRSSVLKKDTDSEPYRIDMRYAISIAFASETSLDETCYPVVTQTRECSEKLSTV